MQYLVLRNNHLTGPCPPFVYNRTVRVVQYMRCASATALLGFTVSRQDPVRNGDNEAAEAVDCEREQTSAP